MGIVSGGSARFNGGTITTPLVIAPTADGVTALTIQPSATAFDVRQFVVKNEAGQVVCDSWTDGSFNTSGFVGGGSVSFGITTGRTVTVIGDTGTILEANGAGTMGFFGKTPAAQPIAIANAAGGVVIDAEARTALNALLAAARTLGLIAT